VRERKQKQLGQVNKHSDELGRRFRVREMILSHCCKISAMQHNVAHSFSETAEASIIIENTKSLGNGLRLSHCCKISAMQHNIAHSFSETAEASIIIENFTLCDSYLPLEDYL
jgi:hypothetical protein